jgi:hypothetical protein
MPLRLAFMAVLAVVAITGCNPPLPAPPETLPECEFSNCRVRIRDDSTRKEAPYERRTLGSARQTGAMTLHYTLHRLSAGVDLPPLQV